MDLTQMTTEQVDGLTDRELDELCERAAYNATIIEHRSVVSDAAHRMARHLRALHHAAERERLSRRTGGIRHRAKRTNHTDQPGHDQSRPDHRRPGHPGAARPPHCAGAVTPSLEGFTAFARRFPPAKTYDWVDSENCLVAAYAGSLGLVYADISRTPMPPPPGWTLDEPFTLDYLALMARPHTYGAALEFARSVLATGGAPRPHRNQ